MVANSFRDEFTRWMTPEQSLLSRRLAGRGRLFEILESRTLLSSTLFVTAPGVPTDATHFQTLQAALQAAVTGDVIDLQNGFMPGTFITTSLTQAAVAGETSIRTAGALEVGDVIAVGNNVGGDTLERALVTGVTATGTGDYQISLATPLLLSHAGSVVDATGGALGPTIGIGKGITLTADAGVVLPFNLEIWQTGESSLITLSQLNLGTHSLQVDGNGSTISNSTLSGVAVMAGAQNNAFVHNTFNIATGNGLTLENAGGTRLDTNTFNVTSAAAFGIVVHNSAGVVLLNNLVKTGSGGTGIYVSVDGGQSTSVDLRGNVVQTAGGRGIYLAKLSTGASLQARVQGNDLRQNAQGMLILGDGSSAGNVDVGGGLTVFGTSTGGNNFKGFGADATHFAIGLFNTSASYYVLAKANVFTSSNPLNVLADSNHISAAAGTGVILASGTFVFEILNAHMTFTVVESSVAGNIASFTDNLSHAPADFTAVIDWGDGSNAAGVVADNGSGGFNVTGGHTWNAAGSYTVTVIIESMTGGNTVASGPATVNPRVLAVQGMSITSKQSDTFNGAVATFTDTKAGGTAADYTAGIAWSDGQTTAGVVSKNADGSYTVSTSRAFDQSGGLTASVSVATVDHLYQATGSLNATISPRVLAVLGGSIVSDQTEIFSGPVATFTDTKAGTQAADYVANIAWSDGQTTAGVVSQNADGSFSVNTSRAFDQSGGLTASVSVATVDHLYQATGSLNATINPRVLAVLGGSIVADQTEIFSGPVATFTDTKAGTQAADYVANIAWSDGQTTAGVVSQNADGSFSVNTSRVFNQAGGLTASVSVATADNKCQGTGSVQATVNARILAATGFDFTLDAGTAFNDVVASFTDTRLGTSTGDYVASVAWSDGMTTAGVITKSADGTFTVSTSRTFSSQGMVNGTVSVATSDGLITAAANLTATVAAPRAITLEGMNFTSDKKTPFNGEVARFTDSLAGTTAANYVASVAWSDGMISNATVTRNADGSFSISTARSFTKAGVLVASVAVGTVDGAFSATASFTATITNSGNKVPHGTKMVVRFIRHDMQRHAHGRQLAWGHCER